MKNQKDLKVSILGKSFSITTDENTEDILQAAELVNELIKEKLSKSPSSSENKIVLIIALQIAADLKKYVREFDQYKATTQRLTELLKQVM